MSHLINKNGRPRKFTFTPRAMRLSEKQTHAYCAFIQRHARTLLIAFAIITAFFSWSLRNLHLRTDFEDLLPRGTPSVVDMRRILERVGGLGTLNIAVETNDLSAAKRFVEDLVATAKKELHADLLYVDYTVDPIRKFYQKNGVLYLSTDELKELDRALQESITQEKLQANPLYLDFEAEDSKDQAQDHKLAKLKDWEEKIRQRAAVVDKFPQGYYIGEKGHLLAVYMRPAGSALEIKGARSLLARIEALVTKLQPQKYHPSIKVGFTGSIKVTVEEHETIIRDLAGTIILCVALVALVVLLYFRRWRVLWLLAVPLAGGATWAFGFAQIAIGYVNAQTAFLGSVIVGTGINYGILLLARYFEERRANVEVTRALEIALSRTLKPTLVAALATGISFGSLSIAHIRSFSQFGLIGGIGMFLCWGFSYTVLPALISLSERSAWLKERSSRTPVLQIHYPTWLARLPIRYATVVVTIVGGLLIIGLIETVRFLPNSLETNGNNLRTKSTTRSGTEALDQRLGRIYGESITPALVLAESIEQAQHICQYYDQLYARTQPRPTVQWCKSIHSFLPDHQEEKLALIAQIRQRLAKVPEDLLPEKMRGRLEEINQRLAVQKLTVNDLPEEVRRRFREKNGHEGTIVFVAPGEKLSLWNLKDLLDYTATLRSIPLGNGQVVHSSGDSVVFADILQTIAIDAPRTTILSALGVFCVLLLVLRRRHAVIESTLALFGGVTLMVGIAATLRVKYNFFNFVALPTTLGIGVDYPINIYQRTMQDGPGSLEQALRRTGPAVFVASLTTIVGYAVLLVGKSLALVSFGKLAILGELTCLMAALFLLPAIHTIAARFRGEATEPAPAVTAEANN